MSAWLEARIRQAPAVLRARVLELAPRPGGSDPSAEQLAAGAERLMADVGAHPGDRSIALDLLAADALITLALLAVAEATPDRLAEFATGLLARGARRPQ